MDFESVLVCSLILAAAFTFLGLIYSPKEKGAASTKIVSMDIEPDESQEERHLIIVMAYDDGVMTIGHNNFLLHDGETVCLVITKFDDHIKIKEKKGITAPGGIETTYTGLATITSIGQRWYSYRFESEVTGQWCTFEFTNVAGNQKQVELSY